MWWILILILAFVALSVVIGGGINSDFVKLLVVFAIGVIVVLACKRIWDDFNRKQ